MILFVPAMAQNTKGDRPQNNRGKIKQNEGKTVKKKGKAITKDIAGRRLRTKNKSSANRANVGIPQPATSSRQPRRQTDRASRIPLNKRYSSRERRQSDPDRHWQGDISGHKPRRITPSNSDANHQNVYPQGRYVTKHPAPKARPFKGFENKTASGKVIVKRSPKRSERAWKGDIKGDPFYPPTSRTGSVKNIHSQKTKYSKYVTKSPSPRDRSYNNSGSIAKARRMGTDTSPKNWKRGGAIGSSGQKPFVTRGRKNVYWGKVKIRERANTRDIAGKPLQKRNFQSGGMGIVGRDTLLFFNRKPHGDAAGVRRKGKFLPGSEAKGGWLNDIAGYRLRKKIPGGAEAPGTHEYSGFRSITGKYRNNKPVQGKTPGIGAGAIAKGLKRTNGRPGGNYQDQGGGFTGFLKARRQGNYHGNARGALWNNNGTAIAGKGVPTNGLAIGRFSGRSRGGKNYSDQGSAYMGDIKRRKLFADEEYAYRGFLKGGKQPYKFSGGGGHKLWNNGGVAVQGKLLPGNAGRAGNFSGNIRGGGKTYADQGGAYTGFLKAKKPYKFLANAPHKLWNNNGKAVTEVGTTKAGAAAGSFQGRSKARPQKGKFLVTPNKLWNNNETPVTELETSRAAAAAGGFQGRKKTREPEKGKIMHSPNVLWNNKGKAVTEIETTKASAAAGNFQGRTKGRRPEKYPLNSSNVMWNNNGKATTQIKLTNAGARAGSFSGTSKYKKESKDRDADIESRIRIKREYTQNPHSVEEAIKKQKPELNYKAGNFSSGAKVVGRRRHNPNSADDALDAYHSSASARRVDYQGNVKMRKFVDRRESPDAKFVHSGENNVKEDRTIMTNVKLFWAKLFQKSDSQPSNLKERSNKLRYDKGEKGMWAD